MACPSEGDAKPCIGECIGILNPLPDLIERQKEDVVGLGEDFLFDHGGGAEEEKVSESAQDIDDVGAPDFSFARRFARVVE